MKTSLSARIILIFTILLMGLSLSASAQTGSIKGTVKTSDGLPAEFVNVGLKETGAGTATNRKGEYVINKVTPGNYTLVLSFIGLETRMLPIEVTGGNVTTVPEITLKESSAQLKEVTIVSGRNQYAKRSSEYVSKLPLKNLENSQVYTSVTKELMENQLVFSVDEGLRNAPGLQKMWESTGRSGDGGSYYNSRGFILQSQLRNGIAGNVSSRIDAANLERIEVIKGPSATLFGSTLTSYGGLINRVTKKPYESFGGEVSVAAGSYGFNRISADVNTPLDSAKKALMRINTAYNYEGSFQDNGFERSFVFAPTFSYKVNDRLSFSLDAEMYSGKNSSKQIIFFYFPTSMLGATNPDELGLDYQRSYSSNDIFQTNSNVNAFAQMNYKLSPKWNSQTVFTRTYSVSNGPYAYFYLIPNSVAYNDPLATGSDLMVRADQSTANSEMHVTEIQQNFTGEFNLGILRNRMVIGLDYFNQNSNQLFYGANFDTIPKNDTIPGYSNFNLDNLNATLQKGFWTYPFEFRSNTYSGYISDVINITDHVIASAGVRYDYFDNIGSYNESTGTYYGAFQQAAISPRFGIVLQPVKDRISVFANYQNGFTNKTGKDFYGNAFKPEQANQLEGGIKLDAFNGRLTSTLSYYDITVDDLVRPDPLNPFFSVQDGSQVSKGFEAEIIATPLNGLNIVAGASYNESKFVKADPDVEGRRPATAMSPITANFWVSYKLSSGAVKGLGAGFGGNYASENKIVNSVFYGEFTLPEYTVLNATVFYDYQKVRVGLKVDNLTDQKYWIGYTTMNPQKLRSVTGSVAIRF